MTHDRSRQPPASPTGVTILPDTLEEVGCEPDRSGMFIDNRGRLALVIEGRGVRASFGGSGDLVVVATMLLRMAEAIAANERQAAETAAGELARIVVSTSIGKPN